MNNNMENIYVKILSKINSYISTVGKDYVKSKHKLLKRNHIQ